MLLGVTTIDNESDTNPNGNAEAFVTTATAAGTSTELRVYVDTGNTAARLVAGIYTDGPAGPGTLLSSGALDQPQAGAWNSVKLASVSIRAGERYWIALMAPLGSSGSLRFRDLNSGGATWTSLETNLTALPGTWSNGQRYNNSPVSAYLVASSTTPPTPPSTPGGQKPVPNATLDTHQVYVDDSGKLAS